MGYLESTEWKTILVNLTLPVLLYRLRCIIPLTFTVSGAIFLATVTIALYVTRQYIRGAQCPLKNRLDGKNVLITGANSGIGFALCKLLLERGAHVHMLCRSRARGEEAIKQLEQCSLDRTMMTLHLADLADLTSVSRFCKMFVEKFGSVDTLVCNAGLLGVTEFTRTVDGHELTYQSNYLAHFLLLEKLLPIISPSGRVINVSSIMHTVGDTVDYKTLNDPLKYAAPGLLAYNRSKLAQVMMTRELVTETDRTIVCCHPGNVHSNILQTGPLAFLENTWIRYLIAFVLKTERDGAQTPLYTCLAEDLVSGAYYRECRLDENVNPLVNSNVERQRLFSQSRQALREFL